MVEQRLPAAAATVGPVVDRHAALCTRRGQAIGHVQGPRNLGDVIDAVDDVAEVFREAWASGVQAGGEVVESYIGAVADMPRAACPGVLVRGLHCMGQC